MTDRIISPYPHSTYRLQMHAGFNFRDASALVPYFASLGVSHLYLSPIWRARPGSTHGYDICDPAEINPELGGEPGFLELSERAASHGLGIILDFVPNHMCAEPQHCRAWRETLRNGMSSPYSDYFDIDWEPVKDELQNKVLLPILGRQYGEVLEAGELRVDFEHGEFFLRYWDHNLPLNPRQCRLILRHRVDELKDLLASDPISFQEYQSILFQLDHLPAYTEISPEAREDRLRELAIAGQRLHRLIDDSPLVRTHVLRNVAEFNGHPSDPNSFNLLHELLEHQVYRLSYWRTALHEINYRRFFDINELAGLRMENPAVFDAAHAKAFELLKTGKAQGLRLDHIDGLYDPSNYLRQLREALSETAPHAYIVVEKILSESEPLNRTWPVEGTTGYEFLNHLNRLYVQPANMGLIRRVYQRFARGQAKFENVIYSSKQQIIATSMASELNVLAHELNRMSEHDRRYRDFTLDSLQEALREVVACFPVYRTYISETGVTGADRREIDEAIKRATERNPALEQSIFSFIQSCLCPVMSDFEPEEVYQRRLRFAMKFQQYTSPVQAKGVEDTAFYRYCPLASLNEVGGEPSNLGSPLAVFHASNAHRQKHHPRSMTATSTHDTKRGEDARARLNVLSELPKEWSAKLSEWSKLTASARTRVGTEITPDRNDEYLFYQNLLAIWPAEATAATPELVQRMSAYMAKAIKEAKVHSSWINPSNDYDAAVARFVERCLTERPSRRFLESFVPFARKVARLGALNSLSHLTLKLASPGVPDFYQGTEFWDLTLVDPDNRRPIAFDARQNWLREFQSTSSSFPRAGEQAKAALTALGLQFRRANPELLIEGSYLSLYAAGPLAEHVVAFVRECNGHTALAAGMRWIAGLIDEGELFTSAAERWHDTVIPLPPRFHSGPIRNVFTGETIPGATEISLSQLFRELPGALLTDRSTQ